MPRRLQVHHIYLRVVANILVLSWLLFISFTDRSVSILLYDADPTYVSKGFASWSTKGLIFVLLTLSIISLTKNPKQNLRFAQINKYLLSSIGGLYMFLAIAVLQSPFHNHMHFAPYLALSIYNIMLAARFYADDRL